MDTNNMVINLDRFISHPVSEKEFMSSGLDMNGTFDSKAEFVKFMMALGIAYPEGIPWEYFWQKVESYRKEKAIELLKSGGFVEFEDEFGGISYKIMKNPEQKVRAGANLTWD